MMGLRRPACHWSPAPVADAGCRPRADCSRCVRSSPTRGFRPDSAPAPMTGAARCAAAAPSATRRLVSQEGLLPLRVAPAGRLERFTGGRGPAAPQDPALRPQALGPGGAPRDAPCRPRRRVTARPASAIMRVGVGGRNGAAGEGTVIFRLLFDSASSTYTYLLASRRGGEALILDPVLEKVDRYLQLVRELDLRLVKAVDTHLHADHITGLGALRDRTRCITVMGEQSGVDVVSMRVSDGDTLRIEGVGLEAIYTPGHTDDSYSFHMGDRVFTGDTLLIRGTGRTDFQNGDPRAQYESIFNRLLRLPEETLVFPAHDYKGDTVSTIGEERAHNPRLQVGSVDEYAALMNGLDLPNPKMMDMAVPANMRQGVQQEEVAERGWAGAAGGGEAAVRRRRVAPVGPAGAREESGGAA